MGSPEKPRSYPSEVRLLADDSVRNWEDTENDPLAFRARLEDIRTAATAHNIPVGADTALLEIGSGKGGMLKYLQEQGIPAVGIDARPRGEINPLSVASRIEILPFRDNSFDIITSSQAFDTDVYNQNQIAMLEEIARTLKPGGIFVARREWFDYEARSAKISLKEEPSSLKSSSKTRVFVKQKNSTHGE